MGTPKYLRTGLFQTPAHAHFEYTYITVPQNEARSRIENVAHSTFFVAISGENDSLFKIRAMSPPRFSPTTIQEKD